MVIQKKKDFPKIPANLKYVAIDTETLEDFSLEGYSFAYRVGKNIKSFYVPLKHEFEEDEKFVNIDEKFALSYLKELVKNRHVIFHNAEFDLTVLWQYDIEIPTNMVEDTMLLHYVLDTERKHGLKDIMSIEYNMDVMKYEEAKEEGTEAFFTYADNDARFTLILFEDLTKQIKTLISKNKKFNRTYKLYREVEIPFIRVMQEMNYFSNYIRVDRNKLLHYQDLIQKEMSAINRALEHYLGEINTRSTKQLAEALLKLGYKLKRREPTAKMKEKARVLGQEAVGNYSLDEASLNALYDTQGGVVLGLLLYSRKLNKLDSTYIKPILKRLEEYSKDVWVLSGYDFFVLGTRTGRLSSSGPNMQNQPRDPVIMRVMLLEQLFKNKVLKKNPFFLETGKIEDLVSKLSKNKKVKKIVENSSIDLRQIYIPMPGKIFIGADYSQLELRVGAALSKDSYMLNAYNEDRDLHNETKEFINSQVGSEIINRTIAKMINFFYQYGGWYGSLARTLKISMDKAKQIDKLYRQLYYQKFDWIEQQIKFARRSHFVQTVLGRRRSMQTLGINDEPKSKTKAERSRSFRRRAHAENAAISTIISGSSADIIKVAMINIYQKYGSTIRQVLQVHDELLIEVDDNKKASELLEIVKKEMETSINLGVKLVADAKLGYSWREVH